MNKNDTIFTVSVARDCPLYDRGDQFTLAGLGFQAPARKPVCLLLTRVIDELVLAAMQHPGDRNTAETINCPGCSGLIKLTKEDKQQYQTVQRQMLATWERRNKQSEIGALTGALATFSFFKVLDEESLKDIIDRATMKNFASDEIILRRGQPGKCLYVILGGRVALVNKQNEAIATLGRGEIFGEMSLLSGNPVSVTVKAADETKCLTLSAENTRAILQRYPFLQAAFTRLLVQRLAAASATLLAGDSSEISGEFTAIALPELLRLLHENGKSGIIHLRFAALTGTIAFKDGEIIVADYQDLQGRQALLAMIAAQKGRFRFASTLPAGIAEADPIGDFFDLLREGLCHLDDQKSP